VVGQGHGAVVLDPESGDRKAVSVRFVGGLERIGEIDRDPPLGARTVMEVHDEVTQTHSRQAADHRIDGGPLLGDEEHALAIGGQRGDEVGDGLALAGARRPLHDEVGAAAGGLDHLVLRGVGVQDEGRARLVEDRVAIAHRDVTVDGREGGGVPGQRGDDVMVGQGLALGGKVGDHRELGVGEVADDDARIDREAVDGVNEAIIRLINDSWGRT